MAVRKDIEKTVHLREFHRMVDQLLTPGDKDYLFYAMKEYNTYKSVAKLMLALNSCLDTPEKLDLLPYVRDLIPKHDRKRFDNLAPYNRMAHPFKAARSVETGQPNGSTEDSSRILTLQRSTGSRLGFSIRGGREHELGIFVSHVDPFSLAEKAGLQAGDQIIAANGISFERLTHQSAVLVLKSHDNLKIEVKNMGSLPGEKLDRNSIVWVDLSGNPIEEQTPTEVNHWRGSRENIEGESSRSRLLNNADCHKIVLHSDKKHSLGFSVRGGAEYGLGIYISMVEQKSASEEAGLKIGDQVVDVNGHSFESIFHQEAVYILKSYPTLILTIKSLGRLPTLPTANNNSKNNNNDNNNGGDGARERSKSLSLPRRFSFGGSLNKLNKRSTNGDTRTESPKTKVKRSNSERTISGQDSVDGGGGDGLQRRYSSPNGSFGTMPNRRPRAISPLATHETRASPRPGRFFEQGIGTQVMLASASSQAEQLLYDHARRTMNEGQIAKLKETMEQYQRRGNVRELTESLVKLLDSPDKIRLLTDIRSLLSPADVGVFDQLVSPLEVEALHNKSDSDSDQEPLVEYNTALSQGEKQRWSGLIEPIRTAPAKTIKAPTQLVNKPPQSAGAVKNTQQPITVPSEPVKTLPSTTADQSGGVDLTREPTTNPQEPTSLSNQPSSELQRSGHKPQPSPVRFKKPTPVVVDVDKSSAFLGLAIEGGSDTPLKNVYVRELREGGAVHKDGFVQAGFEVVQVNQTKIRGKTYNEALEILGTAYNDDTSSIRLIVIPSPTQ